MEAEQSHPIREDTVMVQNAPTAAALWREHFAALAGTQNELGGWAFDGDCTLALSSSKTAALLQARLVRVGTDPSFDARLSLGKGVPTALGEGFLVVDLSRVGDLDLLRAFAVKRGDGAFYQAILAEDGTAIEVEIGEGR